MANFREFLHQIIIGVTHLDFTEESHFYYAYLQVLQVPILAVDTGSRASKVVQALVGRHQIFRNF